MLLADKTREKPPFSDGTHSDPPCVQASYRLSVCLFVCLFVCLCVIMRSVNDGSHDGTQVLLDEWFD